MVTHHIDILIAGLCTKHRPGRLLEIREKNNGELHVHCCESGQIVSPSTDVEIMITIVSDLVHGDERLEEKFLTEMQCIMARKAEDDSICIYLDEIALMDASAQERAEALLRAYNLWID